MSTRLVIENTENGKGRAFSAAVLARVYARGAWDGGATEQGTHRPALLLLGCAHEEAGAIRANLLEGRKMRLFGDDLTNKGEKLEVLKSERFAIGAQKVDEGTLLLVRHPGLFVFSPGMVDEQVRFVCLPPRALIEKQAASFDLEATRTHLQRCGFDPWSEEEERKRSRGQSRRTTRLVAGIEDSLFPTFAALLVAGVAQRVGFPILTDPLFWAQFAAALFAEGLAHRTPRERCWHPETNLWYAEVGVAESGFYPGAVVAASQAQIGEVLARETALFLRR